MTISRHVVVAAALCGLGSAAQAGLRICNDTEFVQSVAIGYKGDVDWTSEGWWNLDPGGCATVVGGDLQKRYYYYRAEVDGGDFPGENYMFCTTPEEFEIVGDADCEARGYDNEAFREIDTGETATDFTFTLVSDSELPRSETPATTPPPQQASETGLTICNATDEIQSVSIGYEADEGFISEGWWNIDPDDCALVLAGELERRYYYYRAEVNAADFPGGEGYMFCTTPEVYTIEGDSNCEARGYDSESFAEIDTGPTALGHTYTIGGVNVVPPEPEEPEVTGNAGLEVCNETEDVQSVSFGYEGPEDWTSEGWWNVDPGDCVVPLLDGVNRRYVYYRAEVDGGDFDGDSYFFCTTPEAFKVVGDSNCEARGYDREEYREIDTGDTTSFYTLTLAAPGQTPPVKVTKPEDDRRVYPAEPEMPGVKSK